MTHSGGKPHAVGDRGQRFEVTYIDPEDNRRKVLGWSESRDGAEDFAEAVKAHPTWHSPQIHDRRDGEISEDFV